MGLRENLATREPQTLLGALAEFSNLGDAPEGWHYFRKCWPDFLDAEIFDDSLKQFDFNQSNKPIPKGQFREQFPTEAARTLVARLQRWRPRHFDFESVLEAGVVPIDKVPFTAKPSSLRAGMVTPYLHPSILRLRDYLRRAWEGGAAAGHCITALLSVETMLVERDMTGEHLRVVADWRLGGFRYTPENQFERACYLLLQNSSRATICANPDCPAPYFIGRRATQRYCSPDCLKPFQMAWTLAWWNSEGKQRRERKRKRGQHAKRKKKSR